MRKQGAYDVLIIGSGMGGMCAAALLSLQGAKTLVVEGLPRIGGRCSTLNHRGFKCITGVLGVELGGVVEALFQETGAEFDVRPAGGPHYLIGDRVVSLPPKGGLKKLLGAASKDAALAKRVAGAFYQAVGSIETLGGETLKEWLLALTPDETIHDVFHTLVAPTLMVAADDISAKTYFRFIRNSGGIRDWGYCPRGSITLPRALLEILKKRGGGLWKQSVVKRILCRSGRAAGALVSRKGEMIEVSADVVISNAGPRKTVRLTGEEHFGEPYMGQLNSHLREAAAVAIQAESSKPLINWDYLLVAGKRNIHSLYQPTNACPELAPKGKHLFIAAGTPRPSPGPLDMEEQVRQCMMDLEDLIPGFERKTRLLLSGCYRGDWPGMHARPGRDLTPETPVRSLYNVGDGVKPDGMTGLPGVVAGAVRTVDLIMAGDIRLRG